MPMFRRGAKSSNCCMFSAVHTSRGSRATTSRVVTAAGPTARGLRYASTNAGSKNTWREDMKPHGWSGAGAAILREWNAPICSSHTAESHAAELLAYPSRAMSPELAVSSAGMANVLGYVARSSSVGATFKLTANPRLDNRLCTPCVLESPIPTVTMFGRCTCSIGSRPRVKLYPRDRQLCTLFRRLAGGNVRRKGSSQVSRTTVAKNFWQFSSSYMSSLLMDGEGSLAYVLFCPDVLFDVLFCSDVDAGSSNACANDGQTDRHLSRVTLCLAIS
mmetsp:Transcript_1991/g.3477  ORF Transcript_1991/g.3477 Transcript_1991/m.3477 type:complete len:275 (-) Transcript_1991:3564-4388(-)